MIHDVRFGREGAGGHAEGFQHRAPKVVRKRFVLDGLQRMADHRDARVRVLRARTRGIDEGRAGEAGDGRREIGSAVVEIVPRWRLPDEPGPVRHEMAQGDGRAGAIVGSEVGEPGAHRDVEVHAAALDLLHDGDVREQLRDRPYAVHGRRRGGHFTRLILRAEALRPDHLVAVHQRDRDSGQPLVRPLPLDGGRERRCRVGVGGGCFDPLPWPVLCLDPLTGFVRSLACAGGQHGHNDRSRPSGVASPCILHPATGPHAGFSRLQGKPGVVINRDPSRGGKPSGHHWHHILESCAPGGNGVQTDELLERGFSGSATGFPKPRNIRVRAASCCLQVAQHFPEASGGRFESAGVAGARRIAGRRN